MLCYPTRQYGHGSGFVSSPHLDTYVGHALGKFIMINPVKRASGRGLDPTKSSQRVLRSGSSPPAQMIQGQKATYGRPARVLAGSVKTGARQSPARQAGRAPTRCYRRHTPHGAGAPSAATRRAPSTNESGHRRLHCPSARELSQNPRRAVAGRLSNRKHGQPYSRRP